MAAIFEILSKKGYKEFSSNLRQYCSKIKKQSGEKINILKTITVKRST
jgi:hypothetical protein